LLFDHNADLRRWVFIKKFIGDRMQQVAILNQLGVIKVAQQDSNR